MVNGDMSKNVVLDVVGSSINDLDIAEGEMEEMEEMGASTPESNENYEHSLYGYVDESGELNLKRNLERGLVNILGINPSTDVFWQGNLYEIKRMLKRLGLRVNTLLDNDFDSAVGAELNIVLSPRFGIDLAKKLERRFEIPYLVNTLPIGITETNLFLNRVAKALWIDADITNGVIEEEVTKVLKSLEKVADRNLGVLRYATITDSNYAVALNKFLSNDLGWIPTVAVIHEKLAHEFKKDLRKQLNLTNGSPDVVFESDPRQIENLLRGQNIDFLLGCSRDKDIARDMEALSLSVSYPVTDRTVINRGYAGYNGTVNLMEDLLSELLIK